MKSKKNHRTFLYVEQDLIMFQLKVKAQDLEVHNPTEYFKYRKLVIVDVEAFV